MNSKVGLTCHGDTGAPAVLEDKGGKYRIVGVLSGSIRSCETSPDVFTRLNDLSSKHNINVEIENDNVIM